MNHIENARKLRDIIEQASASLDDKAASTATLLFPRLKQDGELVKAGTRINWNGTLKRASVDLRDTEDSNPDNAPTLWEDIAYREGYRIIPGNITAGLSFSLGEYGWWGDTLYESLLEDNVWSPEQYPEAWKNVE